MGTTLINGRYDGDLAMVTMDTGLSGSPWMYIGPWDSNTAAPIRELWWRAPEVNDQFCTGGATTGEQCSWTVSVGNTDVQTDTGLARNIASGYRYAPTCISFGDSGGPVYTVRVDGGIAAKGIISAATTSGSPCWVYFTDLRRATYGWPGSYLNAQ